ncbi:hypothetical protein D9M72_320130 [compost metagenome]
MKTLNEPMMVITVQKNSDGESMGSTTRKNRCQAPAPSIRAASSRFGEMPLSPAPSTMML